MNLSTARLCLDCDEVHDGQVCPVCASETFTFISRWIPAPEPRKTRASAPSPEVQAYRELIDGDRAGARRIRMMRQGFIGLTAVGALGWLWRHSQAGASRDREDLSPTSE
jgi:hypothetical protein